MQRIINWLVRQLVCRVAGHSWRPWRRDEHHKYATVRGEGRQCQRCQWLLAKFSVECPDDEFRLRLAHVLEQWEAKAEASGARLTWQSRDVDVDDSSQESL